LTEAYAAFISLSDRSGVQNEWDSLDKPCCGHLEHNLPTLSMKIDHLALSSSSIFKKKFFCTERALLASACTRITSICYLIIRIYYRTGEGILTNPIWAN
jgi:hypothetical protein